ncbi:MAG: hypothetical protein M1131_03695, partial [Actinobacteria bacterium]|nr:hypothetical protein [Actinomycetota bacterium]
MAYNFLPVECDQLYLMPPSVTDWLDEDHLAFFVLDAVDEMDLDPFYAKYREDGCGAPAHDLKMMVALLIYAYCLGCVRKSVQKLFKGERAMVLKRYITSITPQRRLNHPGFDAHFVMCEPRALTRLLSVVLCFCLRQRTPLKTVHEALCVVAVYPCLSDLLEVSQCCNRPD